MTSEAHQTLMRQYDLHWYKLDLQLENNSLNLTGEVTMGATAKVAGMREFAFELHQNHSISAVLVNGVSSTFKRNGGEVVASLPVPLNDGEKFTVQITYGGTAPSGASAAIGNGLNTAMAPPYNTQVTWSLSEPFAAYVWFPCKQLLEDKADSLDVWVTTSVENKVGSNGLLQRVTSLPSQKHRYEWKSRYPIAYYLISVAVGPYQEYSYQVTLPGVAEPLLVQNYLYPDPAVLPAHKVDLDRTGDFLVTFSNLFGVYPFYKEKYGHSMAPIGGGMEHQTMTTQSSFEFALTAHELGHQWWGDEITCAGWSHIWLNEGFASYCEYLAIEHHLPAEKMNWLNKSASRALEQPTGKVFVEDSTNVARIFQADLSYRKGAMVLHMLRHALGDEVFFKVLRAYREAYRFKVASTRDFQHVVEQVSGKSFQYFFDQWVYGEGFPLFEISWAQQGNNLVLQSQQVGSSSATPFFKTEIELLLKSSGGNTLVVVQQNQPIEKFFFKVPGVIQDIVVDPNQWLLEQTRSVKRDNTLLLSERELHLYPNPTGSELTISGGGIFPDMVAIIDAVGRELHSIKPTTQTVSVSGLAAGVYTLRLQYGNNLFYKRFIKL
ncbi:MAG: M1 family aminopeptidase [Rufibacter sp.]